MSLTAKKISAVDEVDAIADDDVIPMIDTSGATPALKGKKAPFTKLATWIAAKFPVPNQATVEEGTDTTPGLMTSERMKQAILALATGDSGPLNNYAATTDPGVGDDSGDGYSVGSEWINVTLDRIWKCQSASVGAAVWERTDQDPGTLNNYAATTNPGVGDDAADGYSVGSRWINVALDTIWTCSDATNGAAVWSQDNAAGGGGMSDPMTANGDIIYRNASGVTTRLPINTVGKVLEVATNGVPSWLWPLEWIERSISGNLQQETHYELLSYAPFQMAVVGVTLQAGAPPTYPAELQPYVDGVSVPNGPVFTLGGGDHTMSRLYDFDFEIAANSSLSLYCVANGSSDGSSSGGDIASDFIVRIYFHRDY